MTDHEPPPHQTIGPPSRGEDEPRPAWDQPTQQPTWQQPTPQQPTWRPPVPDRPELARYGTWPIVVGMLGIAIVLASVLSIPIIGIMALGTSGPVMSNPFTLFLVVLIEDAVFLGLIYFVLIYRGVTSWKEMGLGKLRWGAVGRGLLWGAGFVIVSFLLETLLAALGVQQTQSSQFPIGQGGGVAGLVAMWVAGVVFAPFTEEIFFRGFIFRAFSMRKGLVKGVIYSSLLFGAVHLNLAAFLPITVGAVMLAIGYQRSQDLWVPIIGHALNNFVAFLILTLSVYG